MVIFLDESGIHLKTGHSVYAVVSIEETDLQAVEAGMQAIRKRLGSVAVHWANMRWENRRLAFEGMRRLPFNFQLAVFNNPIENADQAVHETLGRVLAGGSVSSIYIDGKKSRGYAAQLKVSLRQSGVSTRKLKTVNDVSQSGIQIADLIAGLYRHQLDKATRESAALQILVARKQV